MTKLRKDGKPKSSSTLKSKNLRQIRFLDVERMVLQYLRMGYSDQDVYKMLNTQYDYTTQSARSLLNNVKKRLEEETAQLMDGLVERNLTRLEAIIQESYDKEKFKELLSAIDLQNKLANLYKQKVEIDTNTGFEIKLTDIK